jgi:hypothetical protein
VKKIRTGTVIACEYIAAGSNAKYTLVNVYTGPEILIQRYPAAVPVAFYIEIIPERSMGALTFRVFQNKKLRIEVGAQLEFEEGKTGLATLPQVGWLIDKPTTLRVVVSCEGFKPTTVYTKRIRVGEIPA